MNAKSTTVKRLTEQAKRLRGLKRLPRPLPKPGSDANRYARDLSGKERQDKTEAFNRADAARLDKGTIRFFTEGSL